MQIYELGELRDNLVALSTAAGWVDIVDTRTGKVLASTDPDVDKREANAALPPASSMVPVCSTVQVNAAPIAPEEWTITSGNWNEPAPAPKKPRAVHLPFEPRPDRNAMVGWAAMREW